MNDTKRDKLRTAVELINRTILIVESVCDAEDDAVSNYPENLQGTETYEKMEEAVARLSDASDKLNEAKDCVESAIN